MITTSKGFCRSIIFKFINMRVVIYARVSTKTQDYDRQLAELREYADRMGYEVVREFSEKVSGAKRVEERTALTELLNFIKTTLVDKILIYECSRLSRRVVDFLQIVEELTARRISVYIHQNGLETLSPDGTPNPIANLVLGILAQFNSLERNLIRSRMESGYNHYRLSGGAVGRKVGYRKSDEQMKKDYKQEISLIKKGLSLRNIQKITGTSTTTLQKIKKYI